MKSKKIPAEQRGTNFWKCLPRALPWKAFLCLSGQEYSYCCLFPKTQSWALAQLGCEQEGLGVPRKRSHLLPQLFLQICLTGSADLWDIWQNIPEGLRITKKCKIPVLEDFKGMKGMQKAATRSGPPSAETRREVSGNASSPICTARRSPLPYVNILFSEE